MSKFKIPEEHIAGFNLIISLTESQAKIIKDTLIGLPNGALTDETIVILEQKLQLDRKAISKITKTIFSLINLKIAEDTTLEDFVSEVISAFKETVEDYILEDLAKLKNILLEFLGADTKVKKILKASNIIQDNEKVYRDSRILSDIRLVFDSDIDSEKKSAVIIHRLKLDFYENDEFKSQYFALDSSDLIKIKKVIDRAIKKDSIINTGDYSDLSFINLNE